MKTIRWLCWLVLVAVTGGSALGCSKSVRASAPAQPGFFYAVGERAGRPQVWLCPETANAGACTDVTVRPAQSAGIFTGIQKAEDGSFVITRTREGLFGDSADILLCRPASEAPELTCAVVQGL
jgi:hypothetical protein